MPDRSEKLSGSNQLSQQRKQQQESFAYELLAQLTPLDRDMGRGIVERLSELFERFHRELEDTGEESQGGPKLVSG